MKGEMNEKLGGTFHWSHNITYSTHMGRRYYKVYKQGLSKYKATLSCRVNLTCTTWISFCPCEIVCFLSWHLFKLFCQRKVTYKSHQVVQFFSFFLFLTKEKVWKGVFFNEGVFLTYIRHKNTLRLKVVTRLLPICNPFFIFFSVLLYGNVVIFYN